jgi:hypothetical protein
MSIIGNIVWQPLKPVAGESVKIDVCGQDGKPYANQQAADIAIDGVPGSSKFVQFPFPGDKKIFVTARGTDCKVERTTVTITVAAPVPSQATMALIADPANKSRTANEVAWLKATGDVNLLTVGPISPHNAPYKVGLAILPLSGFVRPPAGASPQPMAPPASGATGDKDAVVVHPAGSSPISPVSETLPASAYTWNFGDGSPEVTTTSPSVVHDFETALDSEQEFSHFHVKVSISDAGFNVTGAVVSVGPAKQSYTRTLSVHNPYVHCKKQGYLVPKVSASGWAMKLGNNFIGTAEIENNEAVPITLASRLLIPSLQDTNALTVPTELVPIDPPIVVPAKGNVRVQVTAPFTDVPVDALGFSAVFTEQTAVKTKGGKAASIPAAIVLASKTKSGVDVPITTTTNPIAGLKVRASAHFLVHPQHRGNTPPLVGTIPVASVLSKPDVLKAILGGRPLGMHVTKPDTLETLGFGAPAPPQAGATHVDQMGVKPDPIPPNEIYPLPPKVGNVCDPDNPPEGMPEGQPGDLVCQWTSQSQQVSTNARFLNARKGDVILCPSSGNGSLVDGILMCVTPPQLYGHSGIMTRNYEQITHCTASQDRIMDNPAGDWLANNDEGLDHDVLQYAWPGTLTQTVDHTVNGETIPDPGGTLYSFQNFNGVTSWITFNNQSYVIPPLVVKPDPVLETAHTRTLLTAAADLAFENTQNYHYSFYGFTDPASDTLNAPSQSEGGLDSSSTWAYGTKGAVCSSFVWQMMKLNGVNAYGSGKYATEGELSSYATGELGLQLDPTPPGTLDGLASYTAAERLAGGRWLWWQVHCLACSKAPWKAGWATPTATFYPADQVCNAFATGQCSAFEANTSDDVQPWQNPGDANAVSPSNLLAWNGPDKHPNCVLGYCEPLMYMPNSSAIVPVYEWAAPQKFCEVISGIVTLDNEPKQGVTVYIPGLDYALTLTGPDGTYVFKHIPYGYNLVKAQYAYEQVVGDETVEIIPTGMLGYAFGQQLVNVDQEPPIKAPTIQLSAPDQPNIRTVEISGHASIDCSVYNFPTGTNHWRAYPKIDLGVVEVGSANDCLLGYWSDLKTCHSAVANFSAKVYYEPDYSVVIDFCVELDPQNSDTRQRNYTKKVLPGESYTFVIGTASSILNNGPYQYNGGGSGDGPDANTGDLEASNDCLCCAITFANKEWGTP